jgi:hypothetical protein
VDADRQPARVKEYNVLNYGTVVMEYGGRRENVMSDREQDLTNALIKVTTGRQVKAYFVQGHGEKDSVGSDRNGYANAVELLKRDNYTVEKIVLAQSQEGVPADASVLIIAGPTTDYLKPEVDAIRTYLRKGGKALVMLDPPVGESIRPAPTLESLLKEWSITLGHDVVIDISGMGQLLGTDASVPVVASYPNHPVTENFNVLTAFPLRRSVRGEAGWAGDGQHAEPDSDGRAKLVGIGFEVARGGRKSVAGRKIGRSPRADHGCAVAVDGCARCCCQHRDTGQARGQDSGKTGDAPDAAHRGRGLRLRLECGVGHPGQRRSVRQHEQLAHAAGRSDLDSPARYGRSAHHDDRRSAAAGRMAVSARHSRPDPGLRRLYVVAEEINGSRLVDARAAARRSRSGRLPLLLDSKGRWATNAKKKVFVPDRQGHRAAGDVAHRDDGSARDSAGAWSIVQPAQAPADAASVSDVASTVANLEEGASWTKRVGPQPMVSAAARRCHSC